MGRPRQVSDEQIRDVARACFLDHGPSVSTYVIAERLGISQPALLKRAGSKEELFAQAMQPTAPPEWMALLATHDATHDVPSQLVAIGLALHASLRELVPSLVVMRSSGRTLDQMFPDGGAAPPRLPQRALSRWITKEQKSARIIDGDAGAMARVFIGAIEARCFLEHIGGPRLVHGDTRGYLRELVATLWQGLKPPGERAVHAREPGVGGVVARRQRDRARVRAKRSA